MNCSNGFTLLKPEETKSSVRIKCCSSALSIKLTFSRRKSNRNTTRNQITTNSTETKV